MNSGLKLTLIIVSVVLALIVGMVFTVYGAQNRAYALEEQALTAFADVEVQEKRRIDLIPNLVDCVKNYDAHEAEILTQIAESRDIKASENVTALMTALAEAYPELKSTSNYQDLMNELAIAENRIAEHRSAANNQIKEYKKYIRKFPTRFYLSLTGYEPVEFEYLDFNAPSDAPQNIFGG